ncbi:hypothetical protein JW964_06555 [candidate division KSB1 bacterium]|nr:hypothetical protein [candidate division KSB1 bacterium]
MNAQIYSALAATHLPKEIDWEDCASHVVETRHVRIERDIVELLAPDAILRINRPVPQRGFISFQLFISQIPEPEPNGGKPSGTIFSNRTTTGIPEKGWPTLRIELVRQNVTNGFIHLAIAHSDKREWRYLDSSTPLDINKWYSVTVSWGEAMSIAVNLSSGDISRFIVDSKSVSAIPFSSGLHFLGLGRVDNPFDHGNPLWTPPSLTGAKIRIPGIFFNEADSTQEQNPV